MIPCITKRNFMNRCQIQYQQIPIESNLKLDSSVGVGAIFNRSPSVCRRWISNIFLPRKEGISLQKTKKLSSLKSGVCGAAVYYHHGNNGHCMAPHLFLGKCLMKLTLIMVWQYTNFVQCIHRDQALGSGKQRVAFHACPNISLLPAVWTVTILHTNIPPHLLVECFGRVWVSKMLSLTVFTI